MSGSADVGDAFDVLREELRAIDVEEPELEGLDSDGLIGLALAFVASGQSGDEDAMAEIEDMLGGAVGISVGALRRLTREAREALRLALAEPDPAPLDSSAEFLKAAGSRGRTNQQAP